MTKSEYETAKQEVIAKLGPAEWNMQAPVNESAKQLMTLRVQYMQGVKQEKKKQAGNVSTESFLRPTDLILEPKSPAKPKYQKLAPIVVLDKDLTAFTGVDKEIVKAYFLDRSLSAQQLGHQFSLPYQRIAGLMRRPEFRLLRLKYFEEELGNVTQDAILQMIKHGNPNVVSMATEYLGLMKVKESKDDGNRLVNPEYERYLGLLAEWLLSDSKEPLILTRE